MTITILDKETFGSNIDFSPISKLGKTESYTRTVSNETKKRIEFSDIIITNKVNIGVDEINNAKNLKLICVAATGYNNIDINEAKKRGIVVANVKNYSTESVAQHTFSLILTLSNSLIDYSNEVNAGNWAKSTMFCMLNYPFTELAGKKIGILGYGAIGKRVAEIAKAFNMDVLIGKRPGIKYSDNNRVDLDILLKESDVVSIHTPLSENTLNLIDKEKLSLMKKSSILINVARGGIVNEDDLYEALKANKIKAAATDVMVKEPIEKNSKLIELNNLLITPHMAWASQESRQRLLNGIADNITKFLQGDTAEINVA